MDNEKQFELRHNKMRTIMKKYKDDGLDKPLLHISKIVIRT